MNNRICPYPGLRPFTVEESYFFKGRDLNIRQIIAKLESNKILILTGASGDGKSSLVYAGVIPNARAGFFKAKYNRWLFVDFRPERSPLENLSKSLSNTLNTNYTDTLKELSFGFSSLVDIYKSSSYYINENDSQWETATLQEKKKLNMGAANLFILADQFEEFFTNSENYTNDKTSVDAYTTVNLLLETAKIALKENLPIYIICTLRSDFISQCIAFRGLPETIGFSQFFVPRLNRKELQQVIEEPALMSGGKVSKRLKEVLINELHEGFDQLPILQHTLKQIWEIATNGQDELDLIHLTKVGGMHRKFLTESDQIIVNKWEEDISELQLKYLENPDSSNVLNAHANYLYEIAYDYFLKKSNWTSANLNSTDAKTIIKISFQCLTKIDNGRAVRNRANLQEIVNIINIENINVDVVCGVLNIYRNQQNTLLRPFIVENDKGTEILAYNTVLDITHEALIRNWKLLKIWNEEENQNITNFNEFYIQINRWIENKKSNHYLLPKGTLSYFEDWYQRCKPNKYWLTKYNNSNFTYQEKIGISEKLVADIKEFLEKSRKLIVETEKAKIRRRNILLLIAITVIVTLSGFSYWAMQEKKNADQQKKYAQVQKDSALLQRNIALTANNVAEQERKKAEENKEKALLSKRQSDSARILAEQLKILADDKTILANTEAENARREKQIANEQRQFAEEQKQFADKQKTRAESARDSSKMFTYLAISQSLSLKALQKYDDVQINYLLASMAFHFNKQFKGYEREAAIYNALRFVNTIEKSQDFIKILNVQMTSFFIENDILNIFTKSGDLLKIDLITKEQISIKNILPPFIPVNASFFLTDHLVIVNLENKDLYLVDTQNSNAIKLLGHTDYIRAVTISNNHQLFCTAGRDKTVKLWKLSNQDIQQISSFDLPSRVTQITFGRDNSTIFATTIEGNLKRINLSDNSLQTIENFKSGILSMAISSEKNLLALGLVNGTVKLFDINKNKVFKDLQISTTGIRTLEFSNNSKLLITSSDDKIVKIIDLYNIDKNPMIIENNQQKITYLHIYKDKIYAQTMENNILFWETETINYFSEVKKSISRNFTNEEWKIFIGDKIPIESIK